MITKEVTFECVPFLEKNSKCIKFTKSLYSNNYLYKYKIYIRFTRNRYLLEN